ncbi:MAG: amino acid deaminase [Gemmatimonadetes bacterium]|nr:amino acid deaminase [Gemmatimonadota bacterium]
MSTGHGPSHPIGLAEPTLIDHRMKGVPGGTAPFAMEDVAAKGWNLLREDLPLPVAVLRESALEHNSRWMRRFVERSRAVLAPHGKTTMSPQLFRRQIDDGAWGITVATVHQVQVCREFGFSRVLMANQLIGRQAIRYILDEIDRDADFDFYCLVDSPEGVHMLAQAARARGAGRPLQLLVEGGYRDGRTGCRDLEAALGVARGVKVAEPYLALRGVEGFEGLLMLGTPEEQVSRVDAFLVFLLDIAVACEREGLFADGPIILSAGGSAFYDRVLEGFAQAGIGRDVRVVTRSGCYLTHDSEFYREQFRRLLERSPEARGLGDGLQAALEVWSYVQSRPEPQLALLTMGKRDCGFDLGMPVPLAYSRPGRRERPQPLPPGYAIVAMNDQHAYLVVPPESELRVGDMIASGISHPCLTFDRWQIMFMVDDDYNVTSAIRTYF